MFGTRRLKVSTLYKIRALSYSSYSGGNSAQRANETNTLPYGHLSVRLYLNQNSSSLDQLLESTAGRATGSAAGNTADILTG